MNDKTGQDGTRVVCLFLRRCFWLIAVSAVEPIHIGGRAMAAGETRSSGEV